MKKKYLFLFFICCLCPIFSSETLYYNWDNNYNQGLRNRYSRVDSFIEEREKEKDSSHEDRDKLIESVKVLKDVEEEVFSCLGEGWVLFKQKKYDESFNHIYLLSTRRNYAAQCLLGRFYEYGLGNVHKDINSAYNLYISSYSNSIDPSLICLSDSGISRIIKYIRSGYL